MCIFNHTDRAIFFDLEAAFGGGIIDCERWDMGIRKHLYFLSEQIVQSHFALNHAFLGIIL